MNILAWSFPDTLKLVRAYREVIFGGELKLRSRNNLSNAPNTLCYLGGVLTASQSY
jgi:hypothetical protein